jgi:hypothetical protein
LVETCGVLVGTRGVLVETRGVLVGTRGVLVGTHQNFILQGSLESKNVSNYCISDKIEC